jgi:pyrroline-5-carboxylate reductase
MAEALISAMIASGEIAPAQIVCSDAQPQRRLEVARRHGIMAVDTNREVIATAGIVVLSCKPQDFAEAAAGLGQAVRPDQVIVSIMAGVRIAPIARLLPGRVIRVMPNTPCLIGAMAAGMAAAPDVTREQLAEVRALLSAAGIVEQVSEEQLDGVTGLSGSGPAFVAWLMAQFQVAGEQLGLDQDVARRLTLQTFIGTARLLAEQHLTPEELIAMVSSPGGTTLAGREVLENSEAGSILRRAICRAAQRSTELGNQYE